MDEPAAAARNEDHANEPLEFATVLREELEIIDGQARRHSVMPDERAVYAAIHARQPGLSAICLSGGGIRSATFSLGVLQGLARLGLLSQFNYLSTVSGGGYIGSWLTAWIHRRKDADAVFNELAFGPPTPGSGQGGANGRPRVEPEATPIVNLRRFSNYLAPSSGIMSADSWTLLATVLRNIVLNWCILIPVLMALLAVPRLVAAAVHHHEKAWVWPLFVIGAIGCVTTIAYVSRKRLLERNKRPTQATVVVCAVLPVCLAAICLSLTWVWCHPAASTCSSFDESSPLGRLMAFGIGVMSLGWLLYIASLYIKPSAVDERRKSNIGEMAGELVIYVATGAAGGAILWAASGPFDNVRTNDAWWALVFTTVAPPAFILSFTLAASLFVGLASSLMHEEDREWWSRFGAWALIAAAAWTIVCAIVLLLPQLLTDGYRAATTGAATLLSGFLTVAGGLSSRTFFARDKEKEKAGEVSTAEGGKAGGKWLDILVRIALPVFVVLFAVVLSVLTDAIAGWLVGIPLTEVSLNDFGVRHAEIVVKSLSWNALIVLVAAAIGVGASRFVGINEFSLHAMYRNRLIRAYLGASSETRVPDPFIGFDPADDLALCRLVSTDAKERKDDVAARTPRPLFHVINMALNLVSGDELAWQERKADSMTASALHVGNRDLRYRRAGEYGGTNPPLTLGTAMAISGAAASPNMGYHSSPVLTFLLTLFNARLGWWLGNPGKEGQRTYMRESPRWAVRPLFAEAMGGTDRHHPYIYVSDGGHFENLGLYEMVRRRCRFIVVVDAGADPKKELQDLSAAIRKIRTDFGISIELNAGRILPRDGAAATGHRALRGTIRYGDVDKDANGDRVRDGELVYLKPMFFDHDEPLDVLHYGRTHGDFPHEPTSDQFFSESQFESYRALGLHTVDKICQGCPPPKSLGDFFGNVATHLGEQRASEGGTAD